MPGITTIQGSQPVEYVEESSFASPETDPDMQWIGLVTSFSASIVSEEQIIKYLPDHDNAPDLQTLHAEKVSELHEVEITFYVQDLDFLKYFMGNPGSLTNSLDSIQFGQQDKNNGQFQRIFGGVGEEISISIEEDSAAEISASFICAATEDWSDTDYIGSGTHAQASDPATVSALGYDDLNNVQWGGSDLGHAIESLELSISNSLTVTKDPNSSLDSDVVAITPTDREITIDLSLTYEDMTMANDVRSFTKQDFTFDFGPNSESWTVYEVAFPEFPYEFGPEDLVADSVSSVAATSLSYS